MTIQKLVDFASDLEAASAGCAGDRLYACVQLSMYFRGSDDAPADLARIRQEIFESTVESHVVIEIGSLSDRLYDMFTPSEIGEHAAWFASTFAALLVAVFAYMVADYRNQRGMSYGPGGLVGVLSSHFESGYLIAWKGFYLPELRAEPYRWATSVLLHQGLVHISSNLLMLAAFGVHVERRYGTRRTLAIAVLSGVGGNMMSSVLEDACTVVVGASGLIFGLAGLWVADLVVNFRATKYVVSRLVLTAAFFAYTIFALSTQKNVSHYSHIGGFLAGLFPSMLFLPRFGAGRVEPLLPWVGLFVSSALFLICPLVLYLHRLPGIAC